MAKRNQISPKQAVAVLVICACVYGYQQWQKHKEKQETVTEQTVNSATTDSAPNAIPQEQELTEQAPTGKTTSQKKQSRANGIEIPAYLTDRPEEIVQHDGFTLSYNNKRLVPNWVAWVLTKTRVNGTEKRADNFQPDFDIKKGPIAYDTDYRGSGYDRGHMCPSADCKQSRTSQNECFYFSNMCPQLHELNAGDWEELESLCRRWARNYDSIYIVCGPIIEKGKKYETIGESKVMVPEKFFKVILRWTGEKQCESIGFIYNNDEVSRKMHEYATSVDDVEAKTGINFFSKLPKDIERKTEATYNIKNWIGIK